MSVDWSQQISLVDRQVREGAHLAAAKAFEKLLLEDPPRSHRVELSALARRLGRSQIALGLLRPYVRPSERSQVVATDAERAEYAGALIRIGMLAEAHQLLDLVNPSEYPRSLLFRAFAHVSRWEFAQSELPLRQLLAFPEADPYDKLVAEINLAASLNFNRKDAELEFLLAQLADRTRASKNWFIYSTALEFLADLRISQDRWGEASRYLQEAEALLRSSDTIDALLLRKQRARLELKRDLDRGLVLLQSIRKEALARRHWETLRDCDYYEVLATGNQLLAIHLYFGSPYFAYRERLLRCFPEDLRLPEVYPWVLGSGPKSATIDLRAGKGKGTSELLKEGQIPLRLFRSLAEDFYRPKTLHELHEKLYAGRRFFPPSSRDLIYQALSRLRRFFLQNRIPIRIVEIMGQYRLDAIKGGSVTILCPRDSMPSVLTAFEQKATYAIEQAWKNESASSMSLSELAIRMKTPSRTVSRYLKVGVEKKWIERIGAGRNTRYQRGVAY